MSSLEPVIRIESLSKVFHTASGPVKALDNINLTIGRGDIFGIIGMSGAGKSTLVRCINYLERPTEGRVIVDGEDLSRLDDTSLRKARQSIGMIFQQFNLLMQRTVLGNVLFPLEVSGMEKNAAKKKAIALLERVGLSDKLKAYPAQLSGGQKQRVAIARALANDPKVLLCDEATSALDPTTTRSILSLLRDINKTTGITVVIITHEMAVVEEICSHVAIIDQSRVAEVGRVEDIFSNPQSEAGRRLFFPGTPAVPFGSGMRQCRIVFDGTSSFEPVIANMVLEFRTPVNIMFADTRDMDGKAYGQMVIQLPGDDTIADRMMSYLRARNVTVQEVTGRVE
jgi:D-methionine transport system ATP-binding protein